MRNGVAPSPTLVVRFWAKVDKRSKCWLWTGALAGRGYGVIGIGPKTNDYAHRVSYEIHRGPIPTGFSVLHMCDEPRCVRPAHLFLGRQKDNIHDMIRKGRQARGERAIGVRTLTDEQIRQIRALRGSMSQRKVAAKFDTKPTTVSNIWTGRSWSHVR